MQSYVLVALLAAFIHAFSSVYSKRLYVLADHPAQVAFYSLFSTGLLCGVVLPFVRFSDPSGAWPDVLGAGSCFALGYVALLRAIRIGDASFVVPLIGLKIFFIAGLSALFLAETYGPLVYAGGIGAMVGMFLLGDGRLHGNPRALALMLFTTFCYALTDIFLVRLFRAGFGTLEVMVYLFVVSALLLVPFTVVVMLLAAGATLLHRRLGPLVTALLGVMVAGRAGPGPLFYYAATYGLATVRKEHVRVVDDAIQRGARAPLVHDVHDVVLLRRVQHPQEVGLAHGGRRACGGQHRGGPAQLSGEGSERLRGQHLLDLGADDYVAKPFKFAVLLARIRAVLPRRSSFVRKAAGRVRGLNNSLTNRRGQLEGLVKGEAATRSTR